MLNSLLQQLLARAEEDAEVSLIEGTTDAGCKQAEVVLSKLRDQLHKATVPMSSGKFNQQQQDVIANLQATGT